MGGGGCGGGVGCGNPASGGRIGAGFILGASSNLTGGASAGGKEEAPAASAISRGCPPLRTSSKARGSGSTAALDDVGKTSSGAASVSCVCSAWTVWLLE